MTVKIDRYTLLIFNNGSGYIQDLYHGEKIVEVNTRNKKLTRKLLTICLDYLNKDEESND